MLFRSVHGCECSVFSTDVTADYILENGFDGIFITNGPGDPEPVKKVITLVKQLLGKLPIAGICLGHQIMGLALGGKAYKLKFGHHGANHPIMNMDTRKVEITSQNHGFAIDHGSLNAEEVEVTHINLNDQTVAGLRHKPTGAFSVQYHPESCPGPHDSRYFFENYIALMERYKENPTHKKGQHLHA